MYLGFGSVTRTIGYEVRFFQFCMGSIVVYESSQVLDSFQWPADGPDRKFRFIFFLSFPFLING